MVKSVIAGTRDQGTDWHQGSHINAKKGWKLEHNGRKIIDGTIAGFQAPGEPESCDEEAQPTQPPHHSSRTVGNAKTLIRKDRKRFMPMRGRTGIAGRKRGHTSRETIHGLAIFTSQLYFPRRVTILLALRHAAHRKQRRALWKEKLERVHANAKEGWKLGHAG